MGTDWYENNISHSDFQGPTKVLRTLQEPQCFSTLSSISPVKPIPWTQYLTKKRQLFPGLSPTSQRSIALPHLSCYQDLFPLPGLGILTQFPFGIHLRTYLNSEKYIKDFGYGFLRIPQDRLTHVQLLFTWNPSPHWSSRISLEYLLLPPRSASVTAPGGFTSDPFDAITASFLLVKVSYDYKITLTVEYKLHASASSIFRAGCFGR
jgi:hypothetical protein